MFELFLGIGLGIALGVPLGGLSYPTVRRWVQDEIRRTLSEGKADE